MAGHLIGQPASSAPLNTGMYGGTAKINKIMLRILTLEWEYLRFITSNDR